MSHERFQLLGVGWGGSEQKKKKKKREAIRRPRNMDCHVLRLLITTAVSKYLAFK